MEIKRLPKEVELRIARDFGGEIRRMRKECGLSQKELAKRIGKQTGVSVSLLEKNKRSVTAVDLFRIASVCGYTINITPE